MYGWDDRRLGVAGESGRKAELRRLQSWWRQAELRAAPGEGPSKRSEPVGNQLTRRDIEAQPYLNFLHPFAYRHALRRIDEVQAESGTLEGDRLLRNLLSSMPLAFNAFGALGDHPQFVELLRATFAPRAVGVEEVICEWSPRPKASYLDDNTAFDAVVFYRDDLDRRCALGVEVKYTDSFSSKEYDTARYRALTETSGWFAPGAADRLKGSATNQMWRNVLLAASIERDGTVDRAHVAILCPAGDAGAAAALDGVQAELADAERLDLVALEDLIRAADGQAAFTGWAARMERRYLGPIPEGSVPGYVEPAPSHPLSFPARETEEGGVPAIDVVLGLSWRLAGWLLALGPEGSTVAETHPGGGQYDCLSVLLGADPGGPTVDLNRFGSAHVRADAGIVDEPWPWRSIWLELADGLSPAIAARVLLHHGGLEAVERRPHPPEALGCLAVADALDAGRIQDCRQGVEDSSLAGGIRTHLFDEAGLPVPVRNEEAADWWFLRRLPSYVSFDGVSGATRSMPTRLAEVAGVVAAGGLPWTR